MKKENLPKTIPIFPLSNFIIFPRTTVPLNIFEPRYIDMINDSMKSNKLIGMIQPKNSKEIEAIPKLYDVGCMGKITSFREHDDGQFLIELKGVIRFKIIDEVKSNKKYRRCNVDFNNFNEDLRYQNGNLKFSDLKLIFKDLKSLLKKEDLLLIGKGLEKQSLDETINALAMASPFTLEEKQILLEAKNLELRKTKISEILTTYSFDNYNNTTVQ